MAKGYRQAFTLIELLVVIIIMAALIAVLLPALSSARKSSISAKMAQPQIYGAGDQMAKSNLARAILAGTPTPLPLARVKEFTADITLTPTLSIGTSEPESIYEVKFSSKIMAVQPFKADSECEIVLPLPPEIISLADLSATIAGDPSEMIGLRDGKLVWRGKLDVNPTPIQITYSAVGKGLYALDIPPGGILEIFKINLTANGSDVRMLETSLQPKQPLHKDGATLYTWDYKRLIFGQPIRLDVLGIAPIDRLGQLTWLGPISVAVFGLVVGLIASAMRWVKFDRWVLMFIIGTFTGAYPLMYFAQELIDLRWSIVGAGALVLVAILIRATTVVGFGRALLGTVVPAAAILCLTLTAAVYEQRQGILLTAGALAVFIISMVLLPRVQMTWSARRPRPENVLPLPTPNPTSEE